MHGEITNAGLTLPGRLPLQRRAIPDLLPQQIRRFTLETLRARPVRRFDARNVLDELRANHGKSVLAVDIGGDKIAAAFFNVRNGAVRQVAEVFTKHGNAGAGYLAALREVRALANRRRIPVGVSAAGPTEGTRLNAGPNVPEFISEFHATCDGDFANLFRHVMLANDAEAGIMAAAIQAARTHPDATDVIYIINGSGLGGAMLTRNMIYAAEPGHIEVVEDLNIHGQRKSCGLGGARHVCMEAVAASKAGIEDIWFQRTGERLSGREISARYTQGDGIALDVYDNSALITAHAVKGMAMAFDPPMDAARMVIVGHGGIFQVPGYGDRLRAILRQDLGHTPRMLFTKDFSVNTCLEGAAIAAATG